MFQDLPDDIKTHFFEWVHPGDAHNISRTCKNQKEGVLRWYKSRGRFMISEGGPWRRHLGKRTKDSLDGGHIVSWMPRAMSSIVDQECAVCGHSFRAALNDFGFIGHAQCIRPYLINLYYLQRDFGLQTQQCTSKIPYCKLQGYAQSQGQYNYYAVWRCGRGDLVPKEWTAFHLVHQTYPQNVEQHHHERLRLAEQHHERLRLAEEEKKALRRQRARERYAAQRPKVLALKQRMNHLKSLVTEEQWTTIVKAHASELKETFPDFFTSREEQCSMAAEEIAVIIGKIEEVLPEASWSDIYNTRTSMDLLIERVKSYKQRTARVAQEIGGEDALKALLSDEHVSRLIRLTFMEFFRPGSPRTFSEDMIHEVTRVIREIHAHVFAGLPSRSIRIKRRSTEVNANGKRPRFHVEAPPICQSSSCNCIAARDCVENHCGRCCSSDKCKRHRSHMAPSQIKD